MVYRASSESRVVPILEAADSATGTVPAVVLGVERHGRVAGSFPGRLAGLVLFRVRVRFGDRLAPGQLIFSAAEVAELAKGGASVIGLEGSS